MKNKTKGKKEIEPPVWLVNWMIRERVWRWRVNARVRQWMERQRRWKLRLYYLMAIFLGGLICTYGLVHLENMPKGWREVIQDSIGRQWARRYDEELRFDSLARTPQFERDAVLFWRLADSIEADSEMRQKIDSLFRSRPGLADSLQRVKDGIPRFSK